MYKSVISKFIAAAQPLQIGGLQNPPEITPLSSETEPTQQPPQEIPIEDLPEQSTESPPESPSEYPMELQRIHQALIDDLFRGSL
jgi:hypothetical protein